MRWVITGAGRAMPVDAEPDRAGNIVIDDRGRARVTTPGLGTHTSHFATCPNADSHRRKR